MEFIPYLLVYYVPLDDCGRELNVREFISLHELYKFVLDSSVTILCYRVCRNLESYGNL